MNKIIFFSGMVWLWVGSACAVDDQLAIGSSLPLVPVEIKVREFLQEPLFTAKKKPEINGFMNISGPVILGVAGILCIGPTFYFLKKWWDRSWKELLVLPSSLFPGEHRLVKNGEVDQENNLILPENQPVKKRKVLQPSQFPTLPHLVSNCWLNASVWALFQAMPELVDALLGKDGDFYLLDLNKEQAGNNVNKKIDVEYARAFTKLVRAINNNNVQPDDVKALQEIFQQSGLGESSAGIGISQLLPALSKNCFLWGAQEKLFNSYIPTMQQGAWVGIKKEPTRFKDPLAYYGETEDASVKIELAKQLSKCSNKEDKEKIEKYQNLWNSLSSDEDKSDTIRIALKDDKDENLYFAEVGPYLIVGPGYKFKPDWKNLDDAFASFSVVSTISIETWVTQELHEKMKKENISFEYQLVATVVHQGWGHIVAYCVNENEQCYCFDDIKTHQCSLVNEKITGPFKNGRHPQILVYRRKGGGGVVSVVPSSKKR